MSLLPSQKEIAREKAKAQWEKLGRSQGCCDKCGKKITDNDSYLVSGRIVEIGKRVIYMGDYMICDTCYESEKWGEA